MDYYTDLKQENTSKKKIEKEVSGAEVWLEAIKKAKKEHVIFIAYLFGLVGMLASYGGFLSQVAEVSSWYGGFFTAALILAILLPAGLIAFQLWNEREMIKIHKSPRNTENLSSRKEPPY